MRDLDKMIAEFTTDRKYYKSVWEMIYLSDWFDPIYKAYNVIPNLIHKIKKYHHYGKAGLRTYDFAYEPYVMQAAHIRRVRE